METLSVFIICADQQYTKDEISQQRELCHSALRSLNGYIRHIRGQQQGKQEYGERAIREEQSAYGTAKIITNN